MVKKENGAIARSATDLELGQELSIQLAQGKVKVKITEVNG